MSDVKTEPKPDTTADAAPKTPTFVETLAAVEATDAPPRGPLSVKDGIDTASVPSSRWGDAVHALHARGYVRFVDLTCVDLLDVVGATARFEIVLLVYSMKAQRYARLTTQVDARVASVTTLYAGAHNYEREAYDLFGVVFDGHPSLTRIMLPDGWKGHPLRRDAEIPFEPVDFTVTRDLYQT